MALKRSDRSSVFSALADLQICALAIFEGLPGSRHSAFFMTPCPMYKLWGASLRSAPIAPSKGRRREVAGFNYFTAPPAHSQEWQQR